MLLQILEDAGSAMRRASRELRDTRDHHDLEPGIRDVNQAGTSLGFQPAVVDESDESNAPQNTKEIAKSSSGCPA